MRAFIIAICLAGAARVSAEEVVLRMAAIAPEGTAWAREMRALDRDIEGGTNGAVRMKWYLGGIAGDELTALDRVRKGQLDGLAGAIFCERLAPSLWVTRVVGLVRDREEAYAVLNRLHPSVDREMEQNGFVDLGIGSFGLEVFFTRAPVRSMADLRRLRLWAWNLDDFLVHELPAMGVSVVTLPIEDAAKAYDEGKVDGFISVPTAALAYQWSARAKYYNELSTAFLPGCIVVTRRAFDRLHPDQQSLVRAAAAKFSARFNQVGETSDQLLLKTLFRQQGLADVGVDEALRSGFYDAAARARERLVDQLLAKVNVPSKLLSDVLGWLAEMRSKR